jgi:1-acyl-sn-glycerol-3-phosphate acyltransferase
VEHQHNVGIAARGLRLVIGGLLRAAFRLYFRSINVHGIERFPEEGPVLLVANHPNSLLDPAILVTLLPRPVHFGAAIVIFKGPFVRILEAFGAVPLVRAQDDRPSETPSRRFARQGMGGNISAFKKFARLLRSGEIVAIFPEGITQDDPHLAPFKTGPARIALQAESAADFALGLHIVPVGLQFEPRRQFRGDAFIRIGEPFTIADLAQTYAEDSHRAAEVLTDRIVAGIERVAYHVASTDQIPFVERLVDVYFLRARRTGIFGVRGAGVRGELKQKMAACLNHYAVADPEAVAQVEHELKRYERLRDAAGIDRRVLELPARLLPGPLAPVQAAVEAIVGIVPALFGFLTNAVPFFVTRTVARRAIRSSKATALSLSHILTGAVAFPLAYGLEVAWVWSEFSRAATIIFALLLVPGGLFTWFWWQRMQTIAVNVGGRVASWMKVDALARVIAQRNELLHRMERMRERYRKEVLGWGPIGVDRGIWWRVVTAVVVVVVSVAAAFVFGLRNRPIPGLPTGPSPWHLIRQGEPAIVADRLEHDARGAAAAIEALKHLNVEMLEFRAAFVRGERNFYSQEDEDAIHRMMLAYLNIRTALLRTVWTYRGAHDDAGQGPFESRAFLLAYASAAALFEKADIIVSTFSDNKEARRKLNEGDLAWDIPAGTYDLLVGSLANATVVSELRAGTMRFDEMPRAEIPADEAWRTLLEAGAEARPVIERASRSIGDRKIELALMDLRSHTGDSRYLAQSMVSTWIGDFRLKSRPEHTGLISAEQASELRKLLQPGDILLERRNWFMSNAFLPGYWPHAALYLGDPQPLEDLGVVSDPRVERSWKAFTTPDARGHRYAVIEAISEGVAFTTFEHSVGEADAVAVLRPRLTDAQRREMVARAFSHYGKPYDFEFDFFSTDRLVCTEVVYRAVDGMIALPLTPILGRRALPAVGFVKVYAETRGRDDRPFDLVYFLDAEESRGRAVVASEKAFVETLQRKGVTFLQ